VYKSQFSEERKIEKIFGICLNKIAIPTTFTIDQAEGFTIDLLHKVFHFNHWDRQLNVYG